MTRLCLLPLALAACASVQHPLHRDLVEAEYVVPRDDARSAEIVIQGPGGLSLHSGECDLLQARGRYDSDRARANVDYTIDDAGFGQVKLELINTGARGYGDWDVCVSRDLPLTLQAQGNGDVDVDLDGVQLRGLELLAGAGDVDVDLGGTLIAESSIKVTHGAGDVEIDARKAKITGPASLNVLAGAGDVELRLPADIAVRVVVLKGPGDLVVDGLDKRPDGYVNAAWSDESVVARLDVEIQAGPGDIEIDVGGESAVASTP